MNHHSDFSSSDDSEFDDDFEFKEFLREQRRNRNSFTPQLTEAQKKEQRLKNFYSFLVNGKIDEIISELNDGLDVNQKLQNAWFPLLVASSIANFNLIQELLNHGADITLTKDGDTCLMLACNCPENTNSFEESLKVIELLLERGINPNVVNRRRMNALMFAAGNGHLEAVKLLFPLTDWKVEDNQNWNALFWAVNSGQLSVVKFLIEMGLPLDGTDVRGNNLLEIAREHDFNDILDLFSPEEENDFTVTYCNTDFQSIFNNLNKGGRPQFFLEICKILNGTRCENLIKLFSEKETNMFEFLTSTEEDLQFLGVQMPFQRKRLITGIHRFHKHPFHPNSLATVGKTEIYSTMDTAAAILSAVEQITVMEASLKYITKNVDDITPFSSDKQIRKTIRDIEKQLKTLLVITNRLIKKSKDWDSQIKPVNIITAKSGKRWFPWRKTIFFLGVVAVISLKFSSISCS